MSREMPSVAGTTPIGLQHLYHSLYTSPGAATFAPTLTGNSFFPTTAADAAAVCGLFLGRINRVCAEIMKLLGGRVYDKQHTRERASHVVRIRKNKLPMVSRARGG